MKAFATILLGVCLLTACGFDVNNAEDDETVASEWTPDTVVYRAYIDTVTYTKLLPCTTYVHDTSIVTTVDTVIETIYSTIQDTIQVNDTIYLNDTCTLIQYDTTIQVIHDTLVVTTDTPVASPLDTLPRLPKDAQLEGVQFILEENTLVLGFPDSYGVHDKYISLIIQTEAGIDTLKNQRVYRLSDRPNLINVKPINECIGVLGFHNGVGWLGGYAFKVCEDD